MRHATTFSMDASTFATLTNLRQDLALSSNAEVLRMALLLMGVASKVVAAHGKIVLRDHQGREKELLLVS